MRRFLYILIALLILAVPFAGALGDEDLIYNGDFSVSSADASLPAGWDLSAYVESEDYLDYGFSEDPEVGSYIYIENIRSNDARAIQTVSVEPDTVYRITALVKTENVEGDLGATISIDNFALDGTYCYSYDLFGTNDWEDVELLVLTPPDQHTLRVAMRLGGYSMEACGKACFADIRMSVAEEYDEADVLDLAHETGVVYYGHSDYSEESPAGSDAQPFVYMLLVTALAALAGAVLYVRYLRRQHRKDSLSAKDARIILILIIVLSAVIRMILSFVFVGHSTDINCFMAWGNAMMNGPRNFYTSGMFADYPPGYMYILWLMTAIARLFGLGYGTPAYVLLFKLPSAAADILSVILVYRLALKCGFSRKTALILSALIALNPAICYVTGAWGQIDSILSLGLVAVCMLFLDDRRISAGALYGLMILIKPQALMFGPLLAIAYFSGIHSDNIWKRLLKALSAVAAALAVIFALALPFKGNQGWLWLFEKYASTAGSYAYASIEAFNFHALIGGNWTPVDEIAFLGITYKAIGVFSIAASVAFSAFLFIRSCRSHRGSLYLCGAVMLTLIFTFGHFMHERYIIPALLMLILAYLYEKDRRLLLSYLILSLPLFLNVISAMYIVDHQSMRGEMYDMIVLLGSAAEVLGSIVLTWSAADILLRNHILSAAEEQHDPLRVPDSSAFSIPEKTDVRLRYTKKETILLIAFTLLYAVLAFVNLGTLKAPQTFWQPDSLGESVLVRFPENTHISEYWIYSNIGSPNVSESGTMMLSDGEKDSLYTQTYDDMFRWKPYECDFHSDHVVLTLYSGTLKINEIAFFDDGGDLVSATIDAPVGTQKCLLDEQNTVPEIPSYFNGMYFDELYHGRTAYEHLHNLKPYENSHPPLGKLLIMIGVAIFGMSPFGWRFTGTLIGVLMLPLMYAFGRRMFKRSDYAFLLMLLFAVDFMHFTQTRIATIDVYGVLFILLMFYYMYRYISMNFFADAFRDTLKPLALSGLFFGLGIASKWICFYAGGGLAVLLFYTLFERYRTYRDRMKNGTPSEIAAVSVYWKYTVLTLLWCVLFFVIVPFCIYFASYYPYYRYEAGASSSYGIRDMFRTFWNYQNFMYSYHSGLKATHPYQSSFWQWPFTMKPMWYFYGSQVGNTISTMTASGNPAVWWVSTVGAIALLIGRLTGKIRKDIALQVIFIGVLANYLPWVLVSRCTFIYHFFATVPFILMAAVYLMLRLEDRYPVLNRWKWVWLGLAVLMFVLLYPGISGLRIDAGWAAFLKGIPGGKLMYGA
ncbi:MAG: glycosyltransferase family 39 protein [Clostridia bacterium]|nr:glycosyltransferase family 39 protein [Clostridia bacterium]